MRRTPFLSAHFGLFLLGLVGLVTFIDAESAVYRGHDKEGNIIYSDRPFEGAKEISPPAATRYSPPETPKKPATEAKNTPEPAPVADKNVSYRTISIAQPKNDENIHENGGNLAVTVELSPSLHKEHRLVAVIDGVRQAMLWNTASMAVTDIERGSHKLRVEVVDVSGKQTLGKSKEIVIHMHRASALFRR